MEDHVLVLYRIVRNNPPHADDMRSHIELGIPLRNDDPETLRLANGISLFDSLDRAKIQANRKPWLGNAFIVVLEIPVGDIHVEKTGGTAHFTAWANPDDMLGFVKHTERV